MTVAPTTSTLASIMPSWLDAENLLHALGPYVLLGLALIVFAECGLLVGFILPGDSLLFTAGLFVANGYISTPLWLVAGVLTLCAFLGNVVGYWIGYKAGPALFSKPDSKLFKKEHVDKTHEFFDRYGARAIVMARFVPIVRTFITAMAGVGRMDPKKYFTYSAVGGLAWAAGVTVLGYFLGQIAFVREHVELMLVLVVLVSVVPIAIEALRARREKQQAAQGGGAAGASGLVDGAAEATQRIERVDLDATQRIDRVEY